MNRGRFLLAIAAAFLAPLCRAREPVAKPDFERDIQPLLAQQPEQAQPHVVAEQPVQGRGFSHIYKSTLMYALWQVRGAVDAMAAGCQNPASDQLRVNGLDGAEREWGRRFPPGDPDSVAAGPGKEEIVGNPVQGAVSAPTQPLDTRVRVRAESPVPGETKILRSLGALVISSKAVWSV